MRSLALVALLAAPAAAAPVSGRAAMALPKVSARAALPALPAALPAAANASADTTALALRAPQALQPAPGAGEAPSPALVDDWARAIAAVYQYGLTFDGMQANARVAFETAGAPWAVREEQLDDASARKYWNSTQAAWNASLAFSDPQRLAGTLLPLAMAGQADPAAAAALLDRLKRIKTLPKEEALDALRELEAVRLAAGPGLKAGFERTMDALVRRDGEPIDDKEALKARISEVNRAVQAVKGLIFYPGFDDYYLEATEKLDALQTAWVERWKDALPHQGFLLMTPGATFAGKGIRISVPGGPAASEDSRKGRSAAKPSSRVRSKPAWRKRLKRRR